MSSSTIDFSNLQPYRPEGRKVWLPLPLPWDPQPRLLVCIAGAENKPYAQAVANRNAKRQRSTGLRALADNLAMDRELFAKHVITDWEGIRDSDGAEVPFSPEALRSFLAALPDWIMRRVSAFCAEPSNFLPDDIPTDEEVEAQAGE